MITFDLNDMPPVTEFWELPLYDNEGYLYDNLRDVLEAGTSNQRALLPPRRKAYQLKGL